MKIYKSKEPNKWVAEQKVKPLKGLPKMFFTYTGFGKTAFEAIKDLTNKLKEAESKQ